MRDQAEALGLNDTVFFLGEKANPYPYVRACTVYVQPSRFEGKSIAVDEAMALAKPILLTDFSTATDQIDSGKTGLIVPLSPDGIAQGLQQLLDNASLRDAYSKSLAALDLSNEGEISKLYDLIEGRRPPQ